MSTLKLLYEKQYQINDKIHVVIPTVREVLNHEDEYYNMVYTFTAMPIDMLVELDDLGLDFSQMSAFDLFILMFGSLQGKDTSLLFGDLDLNNFRLSINEKTGTPLLIDPFNDIKIDWVVHGQIAAVFRKIHHLEMNTKRPGNNAAKDYMLQRAREKRNRHKNKAQESQLESLIISLVNTSEFKYNFESVLDLSIYQFNESVHQVINKVEYDQRMHGVYVGMIDAKKLSPDELSWLHK